MPAPSSPRPTASSRSTSRSPGWVEHDADEIWQFVQQTLGRGRRRAGRRRPSRWPPSASPTSARPRSCGTGAPAGRCTGRSCGRTGAPRRAATSSARPATCRWCGPRPAWCSTPTSRPPSSSGCSPRAASRPGPHLAFGTIDSWLLWNLTGGADRRGARHRRLQRQPHDAVRHPVAGVVARAVRPVRRAGRDARRGAAVERSVRRHRRRHGRRRRRRPDQRHRRRPAGRAVRPGLLRAGHDQEHLRHRLVRAHERGRARAPSRSTAC